MTKRIKGVFYWVACFGAGFFISWLIPEHWSPYVTLVAFMIIGYCFYQYRRGVIKLTLSDKIFIVIIPTLFVINTIIHLFKIYEG